MASVSVKVQMKTIKITLFSLIKKKQCRALDTDTIVERAGEIGSGLSL